MAAPQFPVNTSRFDPYKNMKFRIKWDGRYVAGVSKISALKRSTEPVTHREGGDPSTSRVSPSVWKFEPITLERGVTHDKEFEAWANLIYNTDGDAAISLERISRKHACERLALALSAVIEDVDGTLTYWAIIHPAGKPDFHHRQSFAREL